jgi:hypothetical protein
VPGGARVSVPDKPKSPSASGVRGDTAAVKSVSYRVGVALVRAPLLCSAVAACGSIDPDTQANRVLAFFGDTEAGKYAAAYPMLCPSLRARVSRSRFVASKGGAVSSAIPFSGADKTGPEDGPDRTAAGGPSTSWVDVDLARYTHPIVNGETVPSAVPVQHWRINLESNRGHWRICGLRPA